MSFDTVCWSITGASTPAALGRVLANIASQNSQGINLPGDLKVTQLGAPGGGVQISTGAAVLRNAQAAGESYVGKASSTTTVSIAPTGGSARSDLIVAYVIDPDFAPWSPYTTPSQILNGPYFLPGVLAGVANSTTLASQVVSYSAMALARIDIPASTSSITNAMITDLRPLSNPRVFPTKAVHIGSGSLGSPDFLAITDTSFRNWPTDSLSVTVPTWATHCMVSIRLNQVQLDNNGSDFISRVNIGGVIGTGINFDFNGAPADPVGVVSALPFEIFADVNVTSLQGQTVVVKPEAERTFTANTGLIWYTNQQQVIYDLTFVERPA